MYNYINIIRFNANWANKIKNVQTIYLIISVYWAAVNTIKYVLLTWNDADSNFPICFI